MENYGKLKQDVIEKLYHFCAYQERCKQDVTKKLDKLEIPKEHQDWYINHLEEERYLNESRYVEYFSKSRLNGNKWGKRKIANHLKQKGLPEELITIGLNNLPNDTYNEIALKLAKKKYRSVKGKTDWDKKQKVFAYLAQKGFDFDLIKDVTKHLSERE